MDAKKAGADHRWTNERHLRFLKSVEASFVRTMLENDDRLLRMDRYVPDTCESTLDLKIPTSTKKRKRHFPADNLDSSISIDRRHRRLYIHQFSSSSQDDQVVPQIEHKNTNENERNRTSSPLSPASSLL